MQALAASTNTNQVRVSPGVPDRVCRLVVGRLHHGEELLLRRLGMGLDKALVLEVLAEVTLVPCRVDVV
jgi:hypothetical protein